MPFDTLLENCLSAIQNDLTHFANEAIDGLTDYLKILDELPENETKEILKTQALNIQSNIKTLKAISVK